MRRNFTSHEAPQNFDFTPPSAPQNFEIKYIMKRRTKIIRSMKSNNKTRKIQRGNGIISGLYHQGKAAVKSAATVAKISNKKFGKSLTYTETIKFFNKFEDLKLISKHQGEEEINNNNIINSFNNTPINGKPNKRFNLYLGSVLSITSSVGTQNNFVIHMTNKEVNSYIFNAIKQLYQNVFNVNIDKHSGDNAFYTGYIFSTNRSGNNLYFLFFDKITITGVTDTGKNPFTDIKKQELFWVNLYNLIKTYCSDEENESIPCLQVTEYENTKKYYCIYVNNYKRSKTRSIEDGIIELSNIDVLKKVGTIITIGEVVGNNNNDQHNDLVIGESSLVKLDF